MANLVLLTFLSTTYASRAAMREVIRENTPTAQNKRVYMHHDQYLARRGIFEFMGPGWKYPQNGRNEELRRADCWSCYDYRRAFDGDLDYAEILRR